MPTGAHFKIQFCNVNIYIAVENHDEIEQENESFGGKIFESLLLPAAFPTILFDITTEYRYSLRKNQLMYFRVQSKIN